MNTQGPEVQELTKEEALDLERRVKGFNADLIESLKKWELGLGASAFLLPDGRIGARPQVFNDKKKDAPVTGETSPKGDLAQA